VWKIGGIAGWGRIVSGQGELWHGGRKLLRVIGRLEA
jgi:hypothetical protein